MALDIHSQLCILEGIHTRLLEQMCVHHTLSAILAFNIKPKAQMLCAPLVCLLGAANVSIPRPSRPGCFAERCNLGPVAEQFLAARVLPYHVGGVIEVCGFRVWGEDVAEEEVGDTTLLVLVQGLRKHHGQLVLLR